MPEKLALVHLYDTVRARLAIEAPDVAQPFGWREPMRQHTGRRIVWVPGNPAGTVGKNGPARNPGRNPRPLATFYELFHCVISASDLSAPESEIAQYVAVRALHDAWFRAVYHAAHGTFTIDDEQWNIDRQNERRFGATITAVCTIQSMIADTALEGVPADTTIVVDVSLLDVTEPLAVSQAQGKAT